MTAPQPQTLRIVVASPGDVKAERDTLVAVIEELNHGAAALIGLRLELSRWETDAFPGFHAEGAQAQIDATLRIENCDLLIGIFWKRFGAVAGEAPSDADREFRTAYAAWKQQGRPQIMVYFNQRAYTPKSKAEAEQWGQALEFQQNFPKEGLWWPYNGKAQFEKLVRSHLTSFIQQRMSLGQRFAELQNPNPEQSRSVQAGIDLLREELRRASERARESARTPIPIPLPALRGTFMDREGERDTLRHLLRAGEMRLLVIVAPGGYGKTELTTKVLKEAAPGTHIIDPDLQGILYLRCLRGDLRLGRIFAEAGRIVGEQEAFEKTYASGDLTLQRKLEFFFGELGKAGSVWLVLDNFEDLLAGDDTIADPELRQFIESAVATEHRVRLLATTRALPRFAGSQFLKPIDLSVGLPEDQAVEYLRIEGESYGLKDADEDLLRRFVRRVHGIPKALESIIGYLSEKYPVVQLADLMANAALFADFDRFDAENGLKHLIAEQFADQTPDAQLVLCALSVFAKPAPLTALRYLLPALDWASVLPRLERNRLVHRQGDRWDLHPLVREHAYGQIPEEFPASLGAAFVSADSNTPFIRPALHARAADFYKQLRAPQELWKSLADLEPLLDEFHHRVRAGQYEVAARVLNLIDFDYLLLWGHARLVIELREQLIGKLEDKDLTQINVGNLGTAYKNMGRIREAIACYEKALESAQEDKDKESIDVWLGNLGSAYADLGQVQQSIGYYEQALEISRAIGNRSGEGRNLSGLGSVYFSLGQSQQSIGYYEQALDISRAIGNQRGEGVDLGNLGAAHFSLGQVQQAIEHIEQAVAIRREIGDRGGEGHDLVNLGEAYSALGQVQKAIEYEQKALRILREIGDRPYEGFSLSVLGKAATQLDDFKAALQHHQDGLMISQEVGDSYTVSEQLLGSGYAHHWLGHLAGARRCYTEALALDIPLSNYRCAVRLGILCCEENKAEESQQHLTHGVALCRTLLEKTPNLYDALYAQALAQLSSGQPAAARDTYRRALEVCSAPGVVADALQELRLLARAAPATEGLPEATALLEAVLPGPPSPQ